jgi:hypothetical protein
LGFSLNQYRKLVFIYNIYSNDIHPSPMHGPLLYVKQFKFKCQSINLINTTIIEPIETSQKSTPDSTTSHFFDFRLRSVVAPMPTVHIWKRTICPLYGSYDIPSRNCLTNIYFKKILENVGDIICKQSPCDICDYKTLNSAYSPRIILHDYSKLVRAKCVRPAEQLRWPLF